MNQQPTLHHTNELHTAAETLRNLHGADLTGTNAPHAVIHDLYTILDTINEAWPSIARHVGIDTGAETVPDFASDIRQGLALAADGLAEGLRDARIRH